MTAGRGYEIRGKLSRILLRTRSPRKTAPNRRSHPCPTRERRATTTCRNFRPQAPCPFAEPSVARSCVPSFPCPIRRSTRWNSAVNSRADSDSRHAAWSGTWRKSKPGSRHASTPHVPTRPDRPSDRTSENAGPDPCGTQAAGRVCHHATHRSRSRTTFAGKRTPSLARLTSQVACAVSNTLRSRL